MAVKPLFSQTSVLQKGFSHELFSSARAQPVGGEPASLGEGAPLLTLADLQTPDWGDSPFSEEGEGLDWACTSGRKQASLVQGEQGWGHC